MVLMLLAIDASGHLFAWTAARRQDGWVFFWVSLGMLRMYLVFAALVPRFDCNGFPAWVGGLFNTLRCYQPRSPSPWNFCIAIASRARHGVFTCTIGLVGFSQETSISFCARGAEINDVPETPDCWLG